MSSTCTYYALYCTSIICNNIYMAGWAMQNTGRQKARETELAKLRNLGEESATPRKKVHILDMAFHHKETKGMWLQNDHVRWRWQESQVWHSAVSKDDSSKHRWGGLQIESNLGLCTWQEYNWKAIPCQPGYKGGFSQKPFWRSKIWKKPRKKWICLHQRRYWKLPFLNLLNNSLKFYFRMIIPLT